MYPQAHLSPTPRPAKGSRQAAVCRTTSREFHPNCRSDRAAPIVCKLWLGGSTIVIPTVVAMPGAS